MSKKNTPAERLYNGIVKENPTFVLTLGMCPTLAVTTSAVNGLGMGLTTMVVLALCNLIISALRKIIPDKVRIPAFIVIAASLVTMMQLLLQGFIPSLYDSLGIYLAVGGAVCYTDNNYEKIQKPQEEMTVKQSLSFARRLTALVLAAVMLCVAVPAAFAEDAAPGATTIGGANTTLIPEEEENCLSWLFGSKDKITLPYLNIKGKGLRRNVSLDLVDCLVGITYTELGSIGSYVSASAAQEAWKAQAVAIHSYLEYHKQYGSSANALIYTPVEDIPSSARSAIRKAVESVKDEVLTYNGSVIDAVWSASAGYNTQTGVYGTCSSLDAWGSDVPYLKSVESPYERQYHEKMRRIIGKDYDYVEYNDSRTGEPYQSADTTHKDLGGFVQYNTLVSNGRSYRYIGQFVSSRYCFDFSTDAAGVPCMYYYGFGHGVGMSQCGAVGYAAEEGMGYRDILKHYYSGVSIRTVGSGTSSGGGLFSWLRRLLGM